MIISIIGGIGSGKSLTAIKEIIENKQYSLTNFNLKIPKSNYKRIAIEDVIKKTEEINENPNVKKKKIISSVNWDYWDKVRTKHKSFSIYLDEIHNLIHSRRSMSKTNILMSKWVSQIRKITQDSPHNHLYIISQTLRKIDVDFRELCQVFIRCKKVQIGQKVIIVNKFYETEDAIESNRRAIHTQSFMGNPYFKYYDSTEMIRFEDADDYI